MHFGGRWISSVRTAQLESRLARTVSKDLTGPISAELAAAHRIAAAGTGFAEAVLMMELPKRHATSLNGQPVRTQPALAAAADRHDMNLRSGWAGLGGSTFLLPSACILLQKWFKYPVPSACNRDAGYKRTSSALRSGQVYYSAEVQDHESHKAAYATSEHRLLKSSYARIVT